jgi:hypothetical protein
MDGSWGRGVVAVTEDEKSFWQTVPGIITALAALITAIGGLVGILVQSGVIGGGTEGSADAVSTAVEGTPDSPEEASSASSTPADGSALVPWEKATASFVLQDGRRMSVRAPTVGLACNTEVVELENGQRIELRLVSSIRFDAIYTENSSADAVVTLLDGRRLDEPVHTWNCPITGTNELGRLEVQLDEIRQIEFQR